MVGENATSIFTGSGSGRRAKPGSYSSTKRQASSTSRLEALVG
jgi:hypothetical protein